MLSLFYPVWYLLAGCVPAAGRLHIVADFDRFFCGLFGRCVGCFLDGLRGGARFHIQRGGAYLHAGGGRIVFLECEGKSGQKQPPLAVHLCVAYRDFSELERETIWKNTSIKRIGETIAGRYGLAFTYDADDYDIECDEQDGTDSGYYNQLCKNYGLILKVYARRLWVYDRERYKEKRAVKTFHRTQIRPGSFAYTTTLSGTYTGGYFNYTDADKDIDIVCSVGGGTHTKSVNRRATSVYDASVQLCAELNNANHGTVRLRFGVDGDWLVSAGNCINLAGYGKLDGKYFVDKVTHKVSASGLTTDFECSGIGTAFHYWDVGGKIEYHEPEEDSGVDYDSAYATTSPAANAASSAAGAEAGASVALTNAPFYVASTSASPACHKSGTYYFYDGILINGRYRMTNTAARCGKLPVGKNVTGWVPASYCIAGKEG